MKKNLLNNKIIILCGGKGKRLGAITKKIPKPLVKVGNKTIIEHKINYYSQQGFKNYIFCIGYKGKILKDFLAKKCKNSIFSNGGVAAGILKRIYLARNFIKSPAIVSYGDTLAKINFKDLLKKHKKSKAVLTIVVAPIKNPFGIVNWDSNGKLLQFREKPILNHFIGYAVFDPKIFQYLTKKIINMSDGNGMVSAIQQLILKKLVYVYKFNGLQLTVNSINELKSANIKFKKYFTYNETL
jgi:NDP-sugar pyrophosphorylase family protein